MQTPLSIRAKCRQSCLGSRKVHQRINRFQRVATRALPQPRSPTKSPAPSLGPTDSFADNISSDDFESVVPYNTATSLDIIKERTGWLLTFGVGLVAAAFVVEHFEKLIESNVQLSFFVPLIMGHGGNTGSQTVSSVIRALALRQVRWRTGVPVVIKEAVAGGIMGAGIGLIVLLLALALPEFKTETGLAVAVALPVVSFWSNGLAAFVTLASSKLKLDPAMTGGPLTTTIVDSTGLIIYLSIAQAIIAAHII